MPIPPHALAWLHARGINDQAIKSAGLYWDNARRRIAIPITRDDGTVFNKYRRDPATKEGDKFVSDKGGSATLYGWQNAKDADIIVVCEGEMDALRIIGDGTAAVSTTGGANTWKREWSERFSGKTVLIWYDEDDAGISGGDKAAQAIAAHTTKCYRVRHDPAQGKDITDFLTSTGQKFTLKMVRDDKRLHISKAVPPPPSVPPPPRKRREIDPANKLIREDIMARVDMLDLVARNCRPPRRVGSSWVTSCPFHDGGRPSLNVWPDTRRWWCFHCAEGGTCFDWVMRLEGVDFVGAMHLLTNLYP